MACPTDPPRRGFVCFDIPIFFFAFKGPDAFVSRQPHPSPRTHWENEESEHPKIATEQDGLNTKHSNTTDPRVYFWEMRGSRFHGQARVCARCVRGAVRMHADDLQAVKQPLSAGVRADPRAVLQWNEGKWQHRRSFTVGDPEGVGVRREL